VGCQSSRFLGPDYWCSVSEQELHRIRIGEIRSVARGADRSTIPGADFDPVPCPVALVYELDLDPSGDFEQ
jgi:hypothetical protein